MHSLQGWIIKKILFISKIRQNWKKSSKPSKGDNLYVLIDSFLYFPKTAQNNEILISWLYEEVKKETDLLTLISLESPCSNRKRFLIQGTVTWLDLHSFIKIMMFRSQSCCISIYHRWMLVFHICCEFSGRPAADIYGSSGFYQYWFRFIVLSILIFSYIESFLFYALPPVDFF